MGKYKIIFDRDICIGVLACVAVDADHWKAADGEAKADLKDAEYNEETGKYELVIEADEYPVAKESAEVCPVDAIVVEELDD
jgi:ferredoxin